MKKLYLYWLFFQGSISFASSQYIPQFQVGLKGGLNTCSFQITSVKFHAVTSGYLAVFGSGFGALGFNIQPEATMSVKTIESSAAKVANFLKALDVPCCSEGGVSALVWRRLLCLVPVLLL